MEIKAQVYGVVLGVCLLDMQTIVLVEWKWSPMFFNTVEAALSFVLCSALPFVSC